MKKPVLVLSLVLISFLLSAQEYFEWSQPEIITDTNSIYSNPFVSAFDNTSWMFYEKHEDKSSIYKMDLNNIEDNILLLSFETINYKVPYFQLIEDADFLGYLIYLSDEEGADNLYAVKLHEDNSLSSSIKLIQNPDNKDILDYTINFNGSIGYNIDSSIYAAQIIFNSNTVFISNKKLLDSSGYNVQISNVNAFWQRIEMDSSHILTSRYSYNVDSGFYCWQEPTYVDMIGDCRWLSSSKLSNLWHGYNTYCWEKNDTVFGVFGFDIYYDVLLDVSSKSNIRQLSMINWDTNMVDLYYLCFVTGVGDDSEIYSSGNIFVEEGEFITNNNYPDDNPEVFFGELMSGGADVSYYYAYCIWQSHINGKIALSMSRNIVDFVTYIELNPNSNNFIKLSPNPFKNKLSISFNTYGQNAELKIYDINGSQVAGFENINLSNDWQHISWQPTTKASKGIYVVSLQLNGKDLFQYGSTSIKDN